MNTTATASSAATTFKVNVAIDAYVPTTNTATPLGTTIINA